MSKEYGKKLSEIRKAHFKTQKEVADYLGLSAKTVSAWESGRSMPTIGTAIKLAELYQMPLEDLVRKPKEEEIYTEYVIGENTIIDKKKTPTSFTERMECYLRGLSPEQLRKTIAFAEYLLVSGKLDNEKD